ncbi:MAG: hypothetical protein HYS20_13255 [Rhodocyclales bacterium]|nr:hypothetical protein [Rhodocyclales bacterium]
MSLATKYALVGLLWGLVLGYGAVAVTTGLGVAVMFTLVHGAGPWGDDTGSVLYGLAVLGWGGSAVFCTVLGYVHGRRAQLVDAGGDQDGEHRRAHLLAAAAVLAAVLGGYQLYARNAALSMRQNYLDEALQARHQIDSVAVTEGRDGRGLEFVVSADGRRAGRYVLEVSVRDERGRTLHVARNELDAGAYELRHRAHVAYAVIVPTDAGVGEGGGAEPVARRLSLTLSARLTPQLTPRELRTLPSHAAQHYLADDSPFHSTFQMTHVVQWRNSGGRRWVVGRDGEVRELIP